METIGAYYKINVKGIDNYCDSILHFFTAKIGNENNKKIETNHNLLWKKLENVEGKMYFDYHNYIINKYKEKNT